MEITNELVDRLARLARITLSDSERERCRREFGDIIAYMDTLSELETEGAEPAVQLSREVNAVRGDEVSASADVRTVLMNAPESRKNCFSVPKTME